MNLNVFTQYSGVFSVAGGVREHLVTVTKDPNLYRQKKAINDQWLCFHQIIKQIWRNFGKEKRQEIWFGRLSLNSEGNKLSDPKQSLVRRVEDVENSNWKQTSSLPLANEPSIVRQNVGMNPGMDTAAFRSSEVETADQSCEINVAYGRSYLKKGVSIWTNSLCEECENAGTTSLQMQYFKMCVNNNWRKRDYICLYSFWQIFCKLTSFIVFQQISGQ